MAIVVGVTAISRPERTGPPDPDGVVARGRALSIDDEEPPDTVAEVLDDVEVTPPAPLPPAPPPPPEPDAPEPDDATPPPLEAEPDVERDADRPPPPTSVPAPIDATLRTRRAPVPAPTPAPPEAAVAPAAPAPRPPPPRAAGARPPLVPIHTPTPPLVPGGTPGTTLVVVLEYTVGPDGGVTDAVVRASSGSAALDASTRDFVRAHWRYAPPGEPRRVARRFVFAYGT